MLKKIILSLILLNSVVNAQSKKFNFGIKGGASLTSAFGENPRFAPDFDGYDNLIGYNVGLVSVYKANSKFSYQAELLYSKKGFSYVDFTRFQSEIFQDESIAINTDVKLDYIELNLLGKYNLFKQLNFLIGPQFAVLTNAVMEKESPKFELDAKEGLKPIDFGGNIGFDFLIGQSLLLDFRYSFGLVNVSDGLLLISDLKNKSYNLSVGYIF